MGVPKMSSDILCRSINMMEETYLVDNIKEQVRFPSTDLPDETWQWTSEFDAPF